MRWVKKIADLHRWTARSSARSLPKVGKAVHRKGTAHEWTRDEAREAGRKGGKASRGGRGKLTREEDECLRYW